MRAGLRDLASRAGMLRNTRVVPSAKAAATARMRYSSIIDGARSGGTSTPIIPAWASLTNLRAAPVVFTRGVDAH